MDVFYKKLEKNTVKFENNIIYMFICFFNNNFILFFFFWYFLNYFFIFDIKSVLVKASNLYKHTVETFIEKII